MYPNSFLEAEAKAGRQATAKKRKGMSPTQHINAWVKRHGNERDALNCALVALDASQRFIRDIAGDTNDRVSGSMRREAELLVMKCDATGKTLPGE